MMVGVLHLQGSCWPFYQSPRMRRFLKRRCPMWAWPLSRWLTMLPFQGSCFPFYYVPCMGRFLKRRWPMWAWPLSWRWMECCISKALLTFLLLSAHAQVFDEKVANVSLAFELMMDGGLPQPKARPEDIVNLDLKSTLRLEINTFLSCCGSESESGSTGSTCFWASRIRIH